MHRRLCEHRAIDAIVGVGWDRPHHVSRVDILDGERQLNRFEMGKDLVLQPHSRIAQLLVAPSVRLTGPLDQGVTASLGHNNNGVALGLHEVGAMLEDLFQAHVHLWQQADIHIARRQRGHHRQIPAVPPHELDQADTIRVASRLHIRRVDGFQRFRTSCVETECPVQQSDVVVDGLRDAHDGALPRLLGHGLVLRVGAAVGAIAADDEVLPHPPGPERGRDVGVRRVAPVGD
mmetsp:Transcript_23475/g.70540  ORF Transcript_23475/g.70540 Transcript_23475/m.70540 type:complete len:233 (-) Transcript_23475:940-1638(-)